MTALSTRIMDFCTSQRRIDSYLRVALIVLVGVIAYGNTLSSPFTFDDLANIVKNPLVPNFNFEGIKGAFHSRRPIGIMTFQMNYLLSGFSSVRWYHITNITIHILASLSVLWMLRLIMQTEYMENAAEEFRYGPIPFFAALLFVAHPVQTQAVTYIVQRFASLATLFYLLSAASYLKGRINLFRSRRLVAGHTVAWFAAAVFFALLACLTKETSYTLPLAIILLELLFFRTSAKKIGFLIAAGAAVLGAVLLKLTLLTGSVGGAASVLDEATRMQTGSLISRSDYLFTQFRVILRYLMLIVLPINQRVEYDYQLSRSFTDWPVFGSFCVIVILIVAAIWLVKKSMGANPGFRLMAFGIFWFFLGLSVESSIIPIIDLIFEHRLYLPVVGAFTAISSGVFTVTEQTAAASKRRVIFGFLLFIAVLAGATVQRNLIWKSEVSLWSDNVRKSPDSARAWHHLGAVYISKREPVEALKATVRSIELDRSRQAAWNNLGIALDLFGAYNDRFNRTTQMFDDPGAINETTINHWQGEVNNNLGLAYEILGNLPKAMENYSNAIGYNPSLGQAYYNLGIASAKMGDAAKYSEQVQILRMINPALAERLQAIVEKR